MLPSELGFFLHIHTQYVMFVCFFFGPTTTTTTCTYSNSNHTKGVTYLLATVPSCHCCVHVT